MGLPDSHGVSRDPRYLGSCPGGRRSFRLRGCHPLWLRLSSRYSTKRPVCNLPGNPYGPEDTSRNPARTTDTAFNIRTVWAGPLSLAATYGVAVCFLFLGVLRCFNSPGSPPWPMHSARDHLGSPGGVSPFGDPRVSLLPANRGLSQVATSFIASWCLGIHHTPLLAWPKTIRTPSFEGVSDRVLLGTQRPRVAARPSFCYARYLIENGAINTTSRSAHRYPCIQLSKNSQPASSGRR